MLACSSAGGGLRIAVVGYEREVTAEAGHRVGLSAPAQGRARRQPGRCPAPTSRDLRAARPDVVLLVGGTDGGNAEVLLHNAAPAREGARRRARRGGRQRRRGRRGRARCSPRPDAGSSSPTTSCPQIGVLAPDAARAAIREVFLRHVIGGKDLSQRAGVRRDGPGGHPRRRARRASSCSPTAVAGDVLVVDVGGATTDVYSVLEPQGEDAGLASEVVAPAVARAHRRGRPRHALERGRRRRGRPARAPPGARGPEGVCRPAGGRPGAPPGGRGRGGARPGPGAHGCCGGRAPPCPPAVTRRAARARSPTWPTSSARVACCATPRRDGSTPCWRRSPATTRAGGGCRGPAARVDRLGVPALRRWAAGGGRTPYAARALAERTVGARS